VAGAFVAAAVLLGLVAAPASVAATPPSGIPDLAKMALQTSDLPAGARVRRQGYVRSAGLARYEREFASRSVLVGGKRLLGLESDVILERDAATAAGEFAQLRHLLGTKRGRQAVAAQLKKTFGSDADFIRVGLPFGFRAGQESIGLTVTIGTSVGTFPAEFAFFRVDRIVADLVFEGQAGAKLGRSDVAQLARPVAARMVAGLLPNPTVPPAVLGNPAVGTKLTSFRGTWRNGPLSFAYRWQRCDAAGASCADVAGATFSTYVPLDDDAGGTVRVGVTATNGVGSTTRFSAPTGVVAAYSGPPLDVVPPSVTGTAAQGQTLTAGTGVWVGRPTAFSYQWQRCDGAGGNCVAVDGATGATYVVVPADAGMTLRVAVTATNVSGSATAVSPATAAVP
jgi:hypothetical protein